MGLSVHAIGEPKKIYELREKIDSFLANNSKNPFIFSQSIMDQMVATSTQKAIPVVLVFMNDEKVVGVLPLSLRRTFGIQYARFLFGYDYSPDLFFDPQYRDYCMQQSIHFIFNRLGCTFSSLELPADSPNLVPLISICRASKVDFNINNDVKMQYRVLPVNCTWTDFLTSNSKFRRESRKLERKISNAGKIQINRIENEVNTHDVFNKIIEVEKECWKEDWRKSFNINEDVYLQNDWEWSSAGAKIFPNYKPTVWFLELNGQTISYSFVIKYKGTAFLARTSFNNKFRFLSPGVNLNNIVLRDLFESGDVQMLDFMTDLPFMKRWTNRCRLRVRIGLSKGLVLMLYRYAIQQPPIRMIIQRIFTKR